MTKAEWLEKCAARYVERAGMEPTEAREIAEANWEADGDFFIERTPPEEAADNDMDCWDNDGDEP